MCLTFVSERVEFENGKRICVFGGFAKIRLNTDRSNITSTDNHYLRVNKRNQLRILGFKTWDGSIGRKVFFQPSRQRRTLCVGISGVGKEVKHSGKKVKLMIRVTDQDQGSEVIIKR